MAIQFYTSLELDLVYARWTGTITLADISANYDNYLNDIHYRAGRQELVDMSGVDLLDLDLDHLKEVLTVQKEPTSTVETPTRTVIWAPKEGVYQTCRNYFQVVAYYSGLDVHLCLSQEEALLASGVTSDSIEELLHEFEFFPARRADGAPSSV